jgi:hypothetical protein
VEKSDVKQNNAVNVGIGAGVGFEVSRCKLCG